MGIASILGLAIIILSSANLLAQGLIKEKRDVKDFTVISLAISADVYITQADF